MKDKIFLKTGRAGLRENLIKDLVSGFMVFLLALPLSLGIAKASGFDPSLGVLTAMIGGLFVSIFNVSPLAIKGPAVGLITVCAAAIADMDGIAPAGHDPVHMVCGIIVVMALLQILTGLFKMGTLIDFFPHSAIHGMFAAIGIIIIAKQIPVLMGDDPGIYKGETPLELLMDIPKFVISSNVHIAAVGLVSLVIMFAIPMVKINVLKNIPAPIVVLLIAVPMGVYWHFKHDYSLVEIGDLWSGGNRVKADFFAIETWPFWKYAFMFLFVSSLESFQTVKAVDGLDPFKRESSYNGDLIGLGAGNALSGLFGGMPMISEVVRSRSNVGFGARTKWSNFFHGLFLLLAMVLVIPLIELIPNAALAAMLIFAGSRLLAPKEFINKYRIGKEQLAIFLITIFVTLAKDLLLGIAAGIIIKFIFHLSHGASLRSLFRAEYSLSTAGVTTYLDIKDSAVFSNLFAYKKVLANIPSQENVIIDFSHAKLVDHSFLSFIHHFENRYILRGGAVKIVGLENHIKFSSHPLASRKHPD